MTTFLVPYSYKGTLINGSGAIDCQSFQLPFPRVMSQIKPVAGGYLFDFNYGRGARLMPAPFTLMMTVRSSTAAGLQSAFNGFFGVQPIGFYGDTGTFIAKVHGTSTYLDCEAEMFKVVVTEKGAWYAADNILISDVSVTFKPIDLFS